MVTIAPPYTLLVLAAQSQELEHLSQQFQVEYAEDLSLPIDADAVIAPAGDQAARWFQEIEASAEPPDRPLLVLLTDAPDPDQPADLALPPQWLDQALPAALKLRAENRGLQQQLIDAHDRENSSRREHERTAQEVDLLKNAIVRTVSHELKTPLLHVKSAVSMLAEDREEDRLKLIGYAMEATARLEAVIKNITQLADSLEIELEPVQVSDSVAHAIRNLRRSWEHKDHIDRIQVNVEPRLPLVLADKQALGIVLQLLIDNGLKFSRDQVEVLAQVRDNHLWIAVRDHGIGIDLNQIEKIFDPFYQVDNSDARRFGGIGVGLSIVRLILERHHAEIQVESQIGRGSTFSFTLPKAR